MLMELMLPSFLVNHFEIVKTETVLSKVYIYLEENNIAPEGYKSEDLVSHGFHKESKIKDFPIRGKQVLLDVKRRRWKHKETSEIISRDWNVIAKGTRMTQEFAIFLKGLNR